MSAVRQVLDSWVVDLDPNKGFLWSTISTSPTTSVSLTTKRRNQQPQPPQQSWDPPLPDCIMKDQDDPAELQRMWQRFCKCLDQHVQHHRRRLLNPNLKRAIFTSSVENLVTDVSRQMENTKISLLTTTTGGGGRDNHKTTTRYQLRVVRLSHIPEESRNARFCTAEIPVCEVLEAHATVVDSNGDGDNDPNSNFTSVPSAFVEILDERDSAPVVVVLANGNNNDDNEPVVLVDLNDDNRTNVAMSHAAVSLLEP